MTPTPPAATEPAVRNYTADMMALVREAIPEHDHRIPAVAERLVARLRTEDPDLLEGFLRERAYYFLRTFMSEYAASHRRTIPSREQQRRSVFSASAKQYAQDGDAQTFTETVKASPFSVFRVVDGQDLRKPTGKMRAADVAYMVNHYTSIRDNAANEISFWKAVERRIGDREIGEVFGEEEFDRLYFSACKKHYGD